jgi:ABC-2 type transport system ATP-binding protein
MNANPSIVIRFSHVSRRYGKKLALDDVSLEVPRGVVLGLVGANGAGKTTLIKHVLGLLRAQTGAVRVFERDPAACPVEVLSQLGYLSEDRDLPPWMTVGQLLRYSAAFRPKWDAAYAEELRERFQLPGNAMVRTLSKGELAKAGLIVALAHRPELLVLDEPSSGLDPIVRREMLEAVVRSVADQGRTVLFSSHLLDEIARVSDHVAMMAQGKLLLEGPLDQVLESHRRVVVKAQQEHAALARLPGALAVSGGPTEWTVIRNGRRDTFTQALRGLAGEVIEESDATFDEIFHARVARPPQTEVNQDE